MTYASILLVALTVALFHPLDSVAQSRGDRDGRVVVRDRDEPRGRTGEWGGRDRDVERRDRDYEPRRRVPDGRRDGEWDYRRRYGAVDVPAGHLPPPGECRVWYYDRPAGQQPPPTPCAGLRGRRYPNAVVVDSDGRAGGYSIPLPARRRGLEDIIFAN